MKSKYPTKALKDVGVKLYDCVHATPKAIKTGFPYIAIPNIKESRLNLNEVRFISKRDYIEWTKKLKPQEGDVIVTRRGRVGDIAPIPKDFECAIGQNLIILRSEGDEVVQSYLRWVLSGPQYKREVDKYLNVGAIFDSLNCRDIPKFELPFPDKEKQIAIANFFDSIDNQIGLNQQINQTLEQISQAIFKSWFVDFEPVKVKAYIRKLGGSASQIGRAAQAVIAGAVNLEDIITDSNLADLDKTIKSKLEAKIGAQTAEQKSKLVETAKYFPDKLVESELGLIPDGWKIGDLNAFCYLNKNSWTKKNHPKEVWYVDLANTKNGIVQAVQYYSWNGAPSRARRVLNFGDTIVGTVRPGNRSFALIGKSDTVLTCSTGFAVLTPKKDCFREITYLIGAGDENIERLAHLADGAAYPAVRPDVVTSVECVISPENIIKDFSILISPFFEMAHNNAYEQKTLIELRDVLLPKLLSGEHQVDV